MNKKLIIGLVTGLTGIAAVAIIAAVALQPKQIEEREYKTVVEVKPGETSDEKAYDLKGSASDMGFEKVECTDTTICVAKHNAYNVEGREDFVSVMDDEAGQIVSIGIHFTKDDFTVENIYKQLNAVAGNFIGVEIPKEKIEKIKNNLPTSGDDQVSIDTIVEGLNTIEINMLKVEKTNFYLVKVGIFPTTFYNDTKGE